MSSRPTDMPMWPTFCFHVQNSPFPAVIPKKGRDALSNRPASSATPGWVLVRTTSAKKIERQGGSRCSSNTTLFPPTP